MRLDPRKDPELYWDGVATAEWQKQLHKWLLTHGMELNRVAAVESTPEGVVVTVFVIDGDGYRTRSADGTEILTEEHTVSSEDFPWPDWEEVARRLAGRVREVTSAARVLREDLDMLQTSVGYMRNAVARHCNTVDKIAYPEREVYLPQAAGDGD